MRILVAPSRKTFIAHHLRAALSKFDSMSKVESIAIIERVVGVMGAVNWAKDHNVPLVRFGFVRGRGKDLYEEALLNSVTQFRPDLVLAVCVTIGGQRLLDICARAGVPAMIANFPSMRRVVGHQVEWRYEDPRSQGKGSLAGSRGVTPPFLAASS
jgi:hypothetical protein